MSEQDQDHKRELRELNHEINRAEMCGNTQRLAQIIAPEFAFRRASAKLDGGLGFLQAVKMSDRRTLKMLSIDIYGQRAIVTCLVTMDEGKNKGKHYHNIRLFIRHKEESDEKEQWRLLGWANEEVTAEEVTALKVSEEEAAAAE